MTTVFIVLASMYVHIPVHGMLFVFFFFDTPEFCGAGQRRSVLAACCSPQVTLHAELRTILVVDGWSVRLFAILGMDV